MRKLFIITACLLIIASLAVLGASLFAGKAILSNDQRKVVKILGYPDVFMLMMENNDRAEIWTYFNAKTNCIFNNGKLTGYKEQKPLAGNFSYPRIKPTQFSKGMVEKDVLRILPEPAVISEGTIKSIDGTVKIYDYFDRVRIGMVDGKVVYVQTLPFAVEAKK